MPSCLSGRGKVLVSWNRVVRHRPCVLLVGGALRGSVPGLGEGLPLGSASCQLPGEVFFLLSSLRLLATLSFRVYYSIPGLSLDAEGKSGAVPDSPLKKEKGSIFEQKSGALPALEGFVLFF